MIFYGKYNKKTENGTLVNHTDQIFTKNRGCLPILSSNQILKKQLANQPSKIDVTLFHQNIRGLTINKIDEISIYLCNKPTHILCLSEHHLDMKQIEKTLIPTYIFSAHFCRNIFKKGGVCIFTHKTINYMTLNLTKFCKEKDLEICATELHLQYHKSCIMAIYRRPSGDFQYFLNTLEDILNSFHNKFNDIILCGDININSTFKQSMEIMISSLGLSGYTKNHKL